MGHIKSLDLVLRGIWASHHTKLSCIHTIGTSSPALFWLVHPMLQPERGSASSHTLMHSGLAHLQTLATMLASTLMPSCGVGPTLPTLPSVEASEGQGQFSHSHHPKARSPSFCSWGGEGISLHCLQHHIADKKQEQLSYAHTFVSSSPATPISRASSMCWLKWKAFLYPCHCMGHKC